jgi:hypothetical protein
MQHPSNDSVNSNCVLATAHIKFDSSMHINSDSLSSTAAASTAFS